METFLQLVAQDLKNKIKGDLSHTAIIFPNKRASLFFNEYLASQVNHPLWSPAYFTISDLFRQLSILHLGDPIRLVCELYHIFCHETGSRETLDDFYFWGELLISDFDDLDKNLVDADRLFNNLQNLHDITDDNSFLTPEQNEALKQFFINFNPEQHTELKRRFTFLWDKLGAIYNKYQQRLTHLGIAYEGMMYRRVIEELNTAILPHEHYVFVGFNVLNQVESRFFQCLQEAGKALFYWDYDIAYTRLPLEANPPYTHEAGEFILRNLRKFPNELSEKHFDCLRSSKQINLISASTENAQARFLPQWISHIQAENKNLERENAVVLCNESLLLPVLHSIPQEVHNVNVTMGFPLAQTPIYGFINALLELQTSGFNSKTGRYEYENVLTILRHPYTRQLSSQAPSLEQRLVQDNRFYPLPSELMVDDFLQAIFTPQHGTVDLCRYIADMIQRTTIIYKKKDEKQENEIFGQLYRESLFKSYTLVNRLFSLAASGDLEGLRTDTLRRLLNRLLSMTSIPFHGEPAIGMQIMGVLETRNLDFRNLLILSLNEGQLPKAKNEASFIPYHLRQAFGMTTVEHKNAVYAYYFYRLIQRAEHITLLYNTASDGLNRGEMSRFALQFLVEYRHPIHRYYLEAGQSPRRIRPISIEKTPQTLDVLLRRFDIHHSPHSVLSPSALNAYLDCPLMFYYRYVAGLHSPEEVSAEIDSALFGTIFHRSAELTYRALTATGANINSKDIGTLLKDEIRLQSYVDQAFKEKFFHLDKSNEKPEYNGTQLIHSKVIASYLRQLLRNDLKYAPFRIEGMERKVAEVMEISTSQGKVTVNIGGTIDRLDSKGDTLRIVDYKTGGTPKSPESIEQLFTPAAGRPSYIFQTFLYAAIMCRKQPLKVMPALLYIHKAASEDYTPAITMGPARQEKICIDNFALLEEEFRERLQKLLYEIYDPAIPFTQTEDEKRCSYCDFRNLCRR